MTAAFLVVLCAVVLGALLNCTLPPPCERCARARERVEPFQLPRWVQHGLALIARSNAMDIAESIVSVQPMNNRTGRIHYLDVVRHRQGLGSSTPPPPPSSPKRRFVVGPYEIHTPGMRYSLGSWGIVRHPDGRREIVDSIEEWKRAAEAGVISECAREMSDEIHGRIVEELVRNMKEMMRA